GPSSHAVQVQLSAVPGRVNGELGDGGAQGAVPQVRHGVSRSRAWRGTGRVGGGIRQGIFLDASQAPFADPRDLYLRDLYLRDLYLRDRDLSTGLRVLDLHTNRQCTDECAARTAGWGGVGGGDGEGRRSVASRSVASRS